MIQYWFPFGSSPRLIPFLPITTVLWEKGEQGLPVRRRVCRAPIGLMALTKLPYTIPIIHASSAEWKISQ